MGRRRSEEVIANADYVSISELVRLSSVRYSTIKYYTEEELIPFEQLEERLTRRYPRIEALKRLEEIAILKERGWPISEIKNYFKD
ncbi:MerR family transcriptional regulator [Metasolibacillus meyeri]|uniref:MerR family transcriptional regulator n=1 Tax=Metasolibacillus meyeri TaxID=1071052 RepID=UPI000D328231|nr:MerR family transcriptional regulator [Metasolibacillus meyeri]